MVEPSRNIVLTGFMGTGKSTVGRLVAQRLNWPFVDMDQVIAERAAMPINDIFTKLGEAEFRRQELALGSELCQQHGLVIATGGGALLQAQLARSMSASASVLCLDAHPQALLERLEGANDRPLLAAPDREQTLLALWQQRRPLYARLPLHIDTSYLTSEAAADKVVQLARANPRMYPVATPQGEYQVVLMPGAAAILGDYLRAHGVSQRILLVSNQQVWPLYGSGLLAHLQSAGFLPGECIVQDGERYKTLDTVRTIYDACVASGLDRGSVVIALGGGVITDMAGFAAATFLRGIPFIPIPTTLLAMVDASVGGKVAVDLPQGKNLVGAFAQPLQVLLDPGYLPTLPQRELDCGLVEIIKAGIIGDAELFTALEQGAPLPEWRWLIERALAVKIAVVEQDPFESGRRAVLNLGHTFAHAFEVLDDYTLPHGLAVAVGLAAAGELAVIRGHCDAATRDRIIAALVHNHLPATWSGGSSAAVLAAMQQDKKRVNARLRFILPRSVGDVIIDEDVRDAEIEQALERIIR